MKTAPLHRKKMPVRDTYTWQNVIDGLAPDKRGNVSLRHKAREINQWSESRGFQPCITHGVVQRLEQGVEPKDPKKRLALGLPILAPAPVCGQCGEVHITKRCPHSKPAKPRKPRVSVSPENLDWLRAEAEWREMPGPAAVVDWLIERARAAETANTEALIEKQKETHERQND